MMYNNNKAIIAIFFLFISIVVQNTTSCKIDLNSNKIEWKLCRQSQNINNLLKHISFNKFLNTTTYQDECFPAIVPGTALISIRFLIYIIILECIPFSGEHKFIMLRS